MLSLRSLAVAVIASAAAPFSSAQLAPLPALQNALPNHVLVAGGATRSVDLSDYFTLPTVTGPVAQFETTQGTFNAELFATDTPKTVTNFLGYVNRGAYANTVVHRSEAGFLIESGGFTLNGTSITPIALDPPVQNEPKFSNTRGTLVMAKTGGQPHSAQSKWFINLAHTPALDTLYGGFTVFGRVLGTGMTVVDSIVSLSAYDYSAQLGADFAHLPLLANSLVVGNFVLVKSIRVLPVHPEMGSSSSVLRYAATSSDPGVVAPEVVGSTLTLRPVASGATSVVVRATDTNNNAVESTFNVTVAVAPLITTHPVSQAIAAGANGSVSAAASVGAGFRWERNGRELSGVTSPAISIENMGPTIAGLYTAVATSGGAASASNPAIIGVTTSAKAIGSAVELQSNIVHPTRAVFDQLMLTGAAGAVTSDVSERQVTRVSFIDLDHDIVQVEFSGPGTLSLLLDDADAPAEPVNYNQSGVQYVRGHASVVVAGANQDSHLAIFTVGRATAFDPTGTYRLTEPVSGSNNPANNRSPLFKPGVEYGGVADVARVAILSTDGKFGSIRTANVNYTDVRGHTGVYAPGVTVSGPVNIGDINAHESATPVVILGGVTGGRVLITGGDLRQDNGQPVQINGLQELRFTAGTDSHGRWLPAQRNQGILHQNGQDVTSQTVVNP